jgi:hypothetical protein
LELKRDHLTAALGYVQKALVTFSKLVNKVDIAECLEVLAMVAQAKEDWIQAVQYWAVAAHLRTTLGVPIHPHDEKALTPLRTHLSEREFALAWQVGSSLPLETALATPLHHTATTRP